MKPKERYRERPKKIGARKRQKVLFQKRRLIKAGYDKAKLDNMDGVAIRELLKKIGKRKQPV